MIKTVLLVFVIIGFCYCLETNDLLIEETRAKKKKGSAKLLGMILLFIFSKVAIFKAASVFFMMAFFQKLFYLFGLFVNYFLKNKSNKTSPAPVYGAPSDYNTVGYSYGPPEHEAHHQESGYPGISEIGGAFDWLVHKNVK
ncbi:hypothetical protein RR46_12201 [Papilio xuthus]|uniref:Uncharacterized protein n=1 Tax=Papilio xuthus TaxID=66420 RepID=A0A194PPG1_PAPXU|nr:hypothetical protein RR46_12201 [Papilio xuthus]